MESRRKRNLKAFTLVPCICLAGSLFVGCAGDKDIGNAESVTETSEEYGTTLYTYVDDVLIPEEGEVSEGEYVGHLYHDPDFPDIAGSIMTYDIRDYDSDGDDELLVIRFKRPGSNDTGSSYSEYNSVSISMYEEEDGDIVLKEEYDALCPVFGYVGAYEFSGIFLTESEDQIYICGSEFHDAYGYGDGITYNSFVLTYENGEFKPLIDTGVYSGSDFSGIEDYEANALEMAGFLEGIGLEDEAQHIRTDFDRYFCFNGGGEEILMMVVGELDGELEYTSENSEESNMAKNVIYTLSYSKIDINSNDEYLCSFSSASLITDADMEELDSNDYSNLPSGKSLAQMIINEIYAKHGYIFTSDEIQQYFNEKSWYQAESSDMEEIQEGFNEIERVNVEYLSSYGDGISKGSSGEATAGINSLYQDIIDEVTEVILIFENDSVFDYDFSTIMVTGIGAGAIRGYVTKDLNGDGINELIFGVNYEDDYTDTLIVDIYTINNGQLVHVLDGWERNRYYLCTNGIIANEASGGAALSIYNYYIFDGTAINVQEAVWYDGYRNQENPWFYSTETDYSETGGSSITEDMARKIIDQYEYTYLELTPFVS